MATDRSPKHENCMDHLNNYTALDIEEDYSWTAGVIVKRC